MSGELGTLKPISPHQTGTNDLDDGYARSQTFLLFRAYRVKCTMNEFFESLAQPVASIPRLWSLSIYAWDVDFPSFVPRYP